MNLPGVPESLFTEQAGVNKVAQIVNDARCLWRPTPLADVGIDGQIEHVRDNQATGRIVFVQVKSGASYFKQSGEVTYLPDDKHAHYWERADLPVIVILHNPATQQTRWADARHHLRAFGRTPIALDYNFDTNGVHEALAVNGPLPKTPRSVEMLIIEMIELSHVGFGVSIDAFDLFFQGMVDNGRGLYFGMDLLDYVADTKIALGFGDFYGLGFAEYKFIDRYVNFLLTNDLVRFDFDWFNRHLAVDKIVGQIFGPLSPRGRELVSLDLSSGGWVGCSERRCARSGLILPGGYDSESRVAAVRVSRPWVFRGRARSRGPGVSRGLARERGAG